MKKIFGFLLCAFLLNACFLIKKSDPTPVVVADTLPSFNSYPQVFKVVGGTINESSGLVVSRGIPNSLWVEEDSDNPAGLHLLGTDGTYKKFVGFNHNRDCEDIAIGAGPLPDKNYIYLADIGDNNTAYKEYYIYRFLEPTASDTYITNYETIAFTYPGDISYNAETLLLDPKTKDLYVITKDQFNVKVYRLKYPQNVNSSTEAEYLGDIPFFMITGGDISSDGTEILLKSYIGVYYWKIKATDSIFQTLSRSRDVGVPYVQETQGEAIGWTADAKGFYTLSERGDLSNPSPPLYYYTKK